MSFADYENEGHGWFLIAYRYAIEGQKVTGADEVNCATTLRSSDRWAKPENRAVSHDILDFSARVPDAV